MKNSLSILALFLATAQLSCSPSINLTSAWQDMNFPTVQVPRILVLSIGKDLQKRKLAEDKLRDEFRKHGFNALTALDEFGPDLAGNYDSASTQKMLREKKFDGCITVRVLKVDEHDRWMPSDVYYQPMGFYRGFYGYYHRVFGYYTEPGYMVADVEVLLESNFYYLPSGTLLWSGQSKAFSRNPSPAMAARFSKNIVRDMLDKGVIVP